MHAHAEMFPHLDAVFHFHVPKQLSIDTEETKVSLVVIDHTVSLSGRLDEAGPHALLWALQGPQQVPIHGMDQARTLLKQIRQDDGRSYFLCTEFKYKFMFQTNNLTFAATDDKTQLSTYTCTRHLTVMAC